MSDALNSTDHPSDQPPPPRKREWSFYLVLVVAVFPIWVIPPLCLAFVAHVLWLNLLPTFHWPGRLLFAYALAEVVFGVHHFRLARRASGPCPNPPGDIKEIQLAFRRILQAGLASLSEDGYNEEKFGKDRPGSPEEEICQLSPTDPRAIEFRNTLRTWFGRVPFSQIYLKEVLQWLYWSTYNDHLPEDLDGIPETHKITLREAMDLLEKRCGGKILQGSNPSVKPIRLTLDPVNICWRPLGWYIFVIVANHGLRWYLQHYWDVRLEHFADLEYAVRIPPGWTPTTGPQPIIFLHGLGLGLAQYGVIISHLLKILPAHPLLIPLQPHISQHIFHRRFLTPMSRHETVEKITGVVRRLGWEERGVTVLSHSNGSYVHSWLLKAKPELITRSCFVDPVTFCSWEGDVCYNFLYRPCVNGVELVMRYFVGTELGVANLLQRNFDWASNSLWFEEIPHATDPSRTMFFLGGQDVILSAERVRRYLRSHGVRENLWIDPEGHHGRALLVGGEGIKEIIRWIQLDDEPVAEQKL